MTNEEIEKIKSTYDRLIGVKKYRMKLKKELEELKTDPNVQRYVEIKESLEADKEYSFYEIENLEDDKILEQAINSVKISNNNNIYVCMGTYQRYTEIGVVDCIVAHDDPNATYRKYVNIELDPNNWDDVQLIPILFCENFERENIVLYPTQNANSASYYYEIRNMYFDTAIKCGNEKALEKVLYKRNMQRKYNNK